MNRYFYLLFTMLISASVSAQTKGVPDAETDTVEKATTSLTLATLYSSNISYYGQTSAERLPYVLGYAAVRLPSGFWLSGQTYKLFDSQPGISGLNVTAGYDFNLSKNLLASLSYGRSFYPENSQLLQSVNQDVASAALDYDWQWFNTGLTADYALGQESVLYTTFTASKSIDLGLSLSSKDYFTLDPAFEIVGGTQRFSDTTWTEAPPEEEEAPGNGPPVIGDLIGRGNGRGNGGQITHIIPNSDQQGKATVVSSTSFDLLSYSFTIPLAYNRSNYSIEASYQGTILSKAASDSQKLRSFFNLGFYYMF